MKNESKDQRLLRQKGQYNQMIECLKEDVSKMFQRKVARDAYFINYNNIVEEVF